MSQVASFQEALEQFAATRTSPEDKRLMVKALNTQDSYPLRFRFLKGRLCLKYLIETKSLPGAGADWTGFLDWLIKNAPAIIELVMKIIAMFGDTRSYSATVAGQLTVNWDGAWTDVIKITEQVSALATSVADQVSALVASVAEQGVVIGNTFEDLWAHLSE